MYRLSVCCQCQHAPTELGHVKSVKQSRWLVDGQVAREREEDRKEPEAL